MNEAVNQDRETKGDDKGTPEPEADDSMFHVKHETLDQVVACQRCLGTGRELDGRGGRRACPACQGKGRRIP